MYDLSYQASCMLDQSNGGVLSGSDPEANFSIPGVGSYYSCRDRRTVEQGLDSTFSSTIVISLRRVRVMETQAISLRCDSPLSVPTTSPEGDLRVSIFRFIVPSCILSSDLTH